MANVNISAQKLVRGTAGLTPVFTNITNADTYFLGDVDGTSFLLFEGDATNARNVTIVTQGSVDGAAIADIVLAVPSGATSRKLWGIIPTGDTYVSGGKVTLTVDGTGVKMAYLKM